MEMGIQNQQLHALYFRRAVICQPEGHPDEIAGLRRRRELRADTGHSAASFQIRPAEDLQGKRPVFSPFPRDVQRFLSFLCLLFLIT